MFKYSQFLIFEKLAITFFWLVLTSRKRKIFINFGISAIYFLVFLGALNTLSAFVFSKNAFFGYKMSLEVTRLRKNYVFYVFNREKKAIAVSVRILNHLNLYFCMCWTLIYSYFSPQIFFRGLKWPKKSLEQEKSQFLRLLSRKKCINSIGKDP